MTKTGRAMQRLGRVLCALSLLLLSLGHSPTFALPLPTVALAEYVLPDGTIGDICFGSDGVTDHGPSHGSLAPICDYCRLAASVILPSPPDQGILIIGVSVGAETRRGHPVVRVAERRCLPQSRAPPLSV